MKRIGILIQIFLLIGTWGASVDLSNLLVLNHLTEHSHSHESNSSIEGQDKKEVKKSLSYSHHHNDNGESNTDSTDSNQHDHNFSFSTGTSFIPAQNVKLSFFIPQPREKINTLFVCNFSSPPLDSLFRPPLA